MTNSMDLPENHFAVSGAFWVTIMIYFIYFTDLYIQMDVFTKQQSF